MNEEQSILNEVYDYCGRFVIYPSEQARVAHCLWNVGSYFLENGDIPSLIIIPFLLSYLQMRIAASQER